MELVEKVTLLVASYGIYAILVLFVFYVLKPAADAAVRKGSPTERRYFHRVHAATLVFTMVLAVGATVVWVAVNVIAEPMIWGTTEDLLEQRKEPAAPGDPPSVQPKLEPRGSVVGFYTWSEPDSVSHKVRLHWLVRPLAKPHSLRFRLQVQYAVWDQQAALADPFASSSLAPPVTRGYRDAEFTVLVAAQGHNSANPIELVYQQDGVDPYTRLGRMYLRRGDAPRTLIAWDTAVTGAAAPPAPVVTSPGEAFLRWLVHPLLAQARGDVVRFGADGSYDQRQGDLLRRRLGSPDLRQQTTARDAVVGQGSRAVRFITESADEERSRAVEDPSLLLHNLAEALSRIGQRDHEAHQEAWLALALASYRLGDYGSAAAAFRRADSSLVGQPASTLYYRGFGYYQIGQYRDALNDFRAFARFAGNNAERTAAHGMMGLQYALLGKGDSAIAEYRRALTWDAGDDVTRNNLAYQLAEENQHLGEALTLINQVLAHHPGSGNYLDTKAWVLFRMGRWQEALPLVDSAATLAPADTTIRRHRRVIHGGTE